MSVQKLYINEIVNSISETHPLDCDTIYAVNTSDIENGIMLSPKRMSVKDLKGQFKKKIKNGDLLFSEIRPANKRYAVVNVNNPNEYVVSTKLMVLRKFNSNVYDRYFYHYITNDAFLNILQKRAENRICSFPQITFELLSEYVIPVPDWNKQKRIADVLDSIDTKIELNKSICSDLEMLAKEIYDYWFVQFDFPNENGKPYKSSGGKMVWNEALHREIPQGWEVGKFNDIAEFIMGQSPKGDNYNFNKEGLPLLNGAVELTKHGIIVGKYTKEFSRISKVDDWLFCIRATLGNINLSDREYCLGRGVVAARAKNVVF